MNTAASRPESTTGPHFVLCRADKKPITAAWQRNSATLAEAQEHEAKGGLVGLIPGSIDLVAIDLDKGEPAAVVEALGQPILWNPTPRGGRHGFYLVEPERPLVRNGEWEHGGAAGDVRGDNGFVVLWGGLATLDALQDAAASAFPIDLTRVNAMRKRREADPEGETWEPGTRNESFHLAVYLAARRGDMAGIAEAYAKARRSGLPESEIAATGASAQAAGFRDYSPPVTAADFPDDDAPDPAGFLPMSELLALPPERVAWIVEGMLPAAGVSILYADPFAGKSTLARFLAVMVATGAPFLDRETAQGRVMLLALQDKLPALQEAFQALDAPADDSIVVKATIDAPEKPLRALRDWLRLYRPALVVIDTLAAFTGAADWSDYAKASRELTPFLELARESGAAVLFVHHARKQSQDGPDDAVAASLGSQAIAGVADTVLLIRRLEGGRRTLETRQRYGQDMEPALLTFDSETGRFALGASPADEARDNARVAVIEALEAHGELSATALKGAISGIGDHAVNAARDMLAMEGRIESRLEGRAKIYRLLESPSDDF